MCSLLTHNGPLFLVHVGIETLVLEVAVVVARNMGRDPVRLQAKGPES